MVELGFGDAFVQRAKGKFAGYKLIHPDGTDEFKALGKGKVPNEITSLLNINPEVNCQWQHDPPFLLGGGWTPGEVAKVLNRAVNLEVIDSAMYRTNSMKLKTTQALNTHQTEASRVTIQLEELTGLDELDAQVTALEGAATAFRQKETTRRQLWEALDVLRGLDEQIAALPHIPPGAKAQVVDLTAKLARHGELEADHGALGGLVQGVAHTGDMLAGLDWVEDTGGKYSALALRALALATKEDGHGELETINRALARVDNTLIDLNIDIKATQADFDKLMPDECPLCGQEVA